MQALRILIVTHAPLSKELGAGQMAINLADAFREQGHNVTLWSPYPIQSRKRWWQGIRNSQLMRSKLDEFLETQNNFDVIDCYPLLLTNQVRRSGGLVIARSVQPDLLYIGSQIRNSQEKGLKKIILGVVNCFSLVTFFFWLWQAWRKANYILCLGSLELEWMRKWFPLWRNKLISYNNALLDDEQMQLTKIRLRRQEFEASEGVRFIWIGRWTPHKGISELVDFIPKRLSTNPKDTFTIAGCGALAEKEFPIELIQSGTIKIIPSFDRNQLGSLLANHDAGLFTSRVEGWGLVLHEMLESGMRVFATNAGGVPDLEPFFRGRLLPFPPPSELTIDKSAICLNMEGYYNTFSWKSITKKYIECILKE